MEFTVRERATLRAAAVTLVPPWDRDAGGGAGAAALGVADAYVRAVADHQTADNQEAFARLLRTLDSPALNLLLSGVPARFSALAPEARERFLLAWARSRLPVKRQGFEALKRVTLFLAYAAIDERERNPNWPAIGYDAPAVAEAPPPAARLTPLEVDREAALEADLVVVGSGAGGSVIAAAAARAGLHVIILEAGPLKQGAEFAPREVSGTDALFERHGLLATRNLAFSVLHGRCVGGGTTVNWMTCLRPDRALLSRWATEHGIEGLEAPAFAAAVDEVWSRLGVNTDESALTPPSRALIRGATALGHMRGREVHVTPKNARGCANRCDPCAFGCPYGAKQSTLVTYLPDAQAHGAKVLPDTEARHITIEGGGAGGVEAVHRLGARDVEVHLRARAVVVACGAVQTPALLFRSGVRGVGDGLHLHPTTAVGAIYEEPMRAWAGVPQTAHFTPPGYPGDGDSAAAPGYWVETVPAHPGLAAQALPWAGAAEHRALMRRYAHFAGLIVLVRDRSHGRVSVDAHGNPVLDYAMRASDRHAMLDGMDTAARIHAAAGARQILTLHSRICEVPYREGPIKAEELDAFEARLRALGVRPNAIGLFSAHAMGSVPMGGGPKAPTAPTGELRAVRNLFVGDASVLPTAVGANPMITIMAVARRTADFVVKALAR